MSTTVWLVEEIPDYDDPGCVVAVCSTERKAKAFIETLRKPWNYETTMWVIDAEYNRAVATKAKKTKKKAAKTATVPDIGGRDL